MQYCVAVIIPGVIASWGGSNAPQGQASLMSIGALSVEENKKHSKALAEIIEKELGIPSDRYTKSAIFLHIFLSRKQS